jgi:hypothetical protein
MLEAARQKKMGNAGVISQKSPQAPAAAGPTAGATITPSTSRQSADSTSTKRSPNVSGLPFDDELYSHLKYVIEKLTGRMKSSTILTPDEFRMFEESVKIIIQDARGGGDVAVSSAPTVAASATATATARAAAVPLAPPTPTPARAPATAVSKPQPTPKTEKSSVYAAGSWDIEGMETMTSDEYYSALNKRIAESKAKRKAAGETIGGRSSDLYQESLNRPRKQE